jgi:hypothetical protein
MGPGLRSLTIGNRRKEPDYSTPALEVCGRFIRAPIDFLKNLSLWAD